MPLVVLCGFPCSGKSSRSQELQEHLEQSGRKVHIIGDHVLGVDRNAVYADSKKEKELRGSLRAAVERKLNKEEVVILDSPNYIKGYRYELFCLIKHVQTPHCLVCHPHYEANVTCRLISFLLRNFQYIICISDQINCQPIIVVIGSPVLLSFPTRC
ncbi:hypothetical protein XENTR_v10008972 [Xenopus tropicalis]|nr:hypothetical protein XENTR_v10008972 [Xenopus tropicalis]